MRATSLQPHQRTWTGRYVLVWIVGCFAVIGIANGLLAFFALSTFNGVTIENAYETGLTYNQVLADVERQKGMGWSVTTDFDQPRPGRISIASRYVDKSEKPLSGLAIEAIFTRPTHQGADFSVLLSANNSGDYTAETDLPLPGHWFVELLAKSPDGIRYRLDYELMVQ